MNSIRTILKSLLVVGTTLTLAACAHHRDVRPGEDGINRVVIATDDTVAGTRDAISQSNHYCEQFSKQAFFMKEDSKYTGTMDESSYKNSKTAAKVAQAAGGAVWVFGGKQESQLGGLVGLGGGIADQALGKPYVVEMKFKCK